VFNPPPKVKSAVVRLRRNGVDRLDARDRLFVRGTGFPVPAE